MSNSTNEQSAESLLSQYASKNYALSVQGFSIRKNVA